MNIDPIVSEIHRVRRAHAKRCKNDMSVIFTDIRRQHPDRSDLVDLSREKQTVGRVAEGAAVYGMKRRKTV